MEPLESFSAREKGVYTYPSQELEEDRIILEEDLDPDYEPSDEETKEYAKFIGMDLEKEQDLLYLAREALKAPLPAGWNACKTPDGLIYFFNFETGESKWDSPLDDQYRAKLREARMVRGSKTPPRSAERKQVRFSASSPKLNPVPNLNLFQRHSASLPNIQVKGITPGKLLPTNPRTPDKGIPRRQTNSNSRVKSPSGSKSLPETELKAKIAVLQEKNSNIVEEKDAEKKAEEMSTQRERDLKELKEKKEFEFEWRKKQELKKYENQLAKMMRTIDEDLGLDRLRQEAQLDAKVIDRLEKEAREQFTAESTAILDNFVAESAKMQENHSRLLKQQTEEKSREMSQLLATNMKDLENEISQKKKRIEEIKNLKILKKKKELQEYMENIEKEKEELSLDLKEKLGDFEKSQQERQEAEVSQLKEKFSQELDRAREVYKREYESQIQEIKDQIESEYRKKFDFVKMDLREELQRIVPTYEVTSRKAMDAVLAEEIKEALEKKYKGAEESQAVDQVIYGQTLKQKLADLQSKLKSDFEIAKQEMEQAEKAKVDQLTEEINQIREEIKLANDVRALLQKYADDTVILKETLKSKDAEIETLVQEANSQLDSLENLGNQFDQLDKECIEARKQRRIKDIIARDVDDLNKRISNKSKSISELRADRPLYERPLVAENLDVVAESAQANNEHLVDVMKDFESAKNSIRKKAISMRNSLSAERSRHSSPRRSYKGSPVSKRVTFFDQSERSHSHGPERESSRQRRSPRASYSAYAQDMLNRLESKKVSEIEEDFSYLRDYWLRKLREEEMIVESVRAAAEKSKEKLKIQLTFLQEEQEHYRRECLDMKFTSSDYLRHNPRLLAIRDGLNARIDHYNNELLKLKRTELDNDKIEAGFLAFEMAVKDAISSRRLDNDYLVKVYASYKESYLGADRGSTRSLERKKRDSVKMRDLADHSENISVYQSYNTGNKGLRRIDDYALNSIDTIKKEPRKALKSPSHASHTSSASRNTLSRTTIKNAKY